MSHHDDDEDPSHPPRFGCMPKVPSLQQLCHRVLVGHLEHLSDVGDMEPSLLLPVLRHADHNQLQRIEDASESCPLASVTDGLWRGLFERRFGPSNVQEALAGMRAQQQLYSWRLLFMARLAVEAETQAAIGERMRQRYKEANKEKQRHTVQVCSKLPPAKRQSAFPLSHAAPARTARTMGSGGGSSVLQKVRASFRASTTARVRQQLPTPTSRRRPSLHPPRPSPMSASSPAKQQATTIGHKRPHPSSSALNSRPDITALSRISPPPRSTTNSSSRPPSRSDHLSSSYVPPVLRRIVAPFAPTSLASSTPSSRLSQDPPSRDSSSDRPISRIKQQKHLPPHASSYSTLSPPSRSPPPSHRRTHTDEQWRKAEGARKEQGMQRGSSSGRPVMERSHGRAVGSVKLEKRLREGEEGGRGSVKERREW